MIKTVRLSETLIRTYSDTGYKIARDGVKYDEAVDPACLNRVYIETDELIDGNSPLGEIDDTYALHIITGEV